MKITFYGVRGSFPVPGEETKRYGGNTTCVAFSKIVDGKIKRLIIDCGTGAVRLGKEIVQNFVQQQEDLDITMLFTHLHPDHTQAFPFFSPNYFKECKMSLFGMKTLKKHVGTVLEQSMLPPTFPIEYKDLKSERKHYEIKDGSVLNIPLNTKEKPLFIVHVMQAYAPSHPQQGAIYYKVVDPDSNKSVACIWDLESKQGGDKMVVNFAKDCDIMIHDTQYTNEEYISDKMVVQGFGHSTYDMAIENATQAGIKDTLICTHYNPSHTDGFLDAVVGSLEDRRDLPFQVILARESLEVEV